MNEPHEISEHVRRINLLNSISTGSLATLSESMRLGSESDNGNHGCSRLAAGNVDCRCDYCESFWSRLEELIAA